MMSYRDMLGYYRTAIARCIDIMTMGEFDEDAAIAQGYHSDLKAIIDLDNGPMTVMQGNVSIFESELRYFDDDQRIILEKMSYILHSLDEIDQELIMHVKDGYFDKSGN